MFNLEKRFKRQPELKASYAAFLSEYESLGQMSQVENDDPGQVSYYLPHHCVIKSESSSTKLRVIFDGSAITSTGYSLNDLQMVGPVIQNDLFEILLRFRKHTYIVVSDIERMYRQVLINPAQRSLQRILWRSHPDEPIKIYDFNTVTYGTAAASFLAVRSLTQLAYECEDELPEIARVILNDFYVDDLLTGADSVQEAKFVADNVAKVLARGRFPLRKWASNEPSIIHDVIDGGDGRSTVDLVSDKTVKILGLRWDTICDNLNFVKKNESARVSKKQILPEISQIFDPLGLLGPVIIIAKILLQKLWLSKVSWDESLSVGMHSQWTSYRRDLQL